MENGSHSASPHGHRIVLLARPLLHRMGMAPGDPESVRMQIHQSQSLVCHRDVDVVLVA
jgi:hypothetical protein